VDVSLQLFIQMHLQPGSALDRNYTLKENFKPLIELVDAIL